MFTPCVSSLCNLTAATEESPEKISQISKYLADSQPCNSTFQSCESSNLRPPKILTTISNAVVEEESFSKRSDRKTSVQNPKYKSISSIEIQKPDQQSWCSMKHVNQGIPCQRSAHRSSSLSKAEIGVLQKKERTPLLESPISRALVKIKLVLIYPQDPFDC